MRRNAVFAGHLDYVDVGAAVFARVGELVPGDGIEIVSVTGEQFAYAVEWVQLFRTEEAPVDEILRQPDDEELVTLITCGGTFDPATALYSDRLIARAVRSA